MSGTSEGEWSEEFDLIVLGAGGAGMTAALVGAVEGLKTVVLERSAEIGGTTALSSGTLWVPGYDAAEGENPKAAADAAVYLDALVGEKADPALRRAFLSHGPEMLRYLAANSLVRFRTYAATPDYHQHLPGASLGGQAHEPLPFDAAALGSTFGALRPPLRELMLFGGMMVTRGEAARLLAGPWSWDAVKLAAALTGRFLVDRLRYRRGTRLVIGNALAARLCASLQQHGVPIRRLQAPVELLHGDSGIEGIVVSDAGRRRRLRARRGIVLAGGGFPANFEWRKRYLPSPVPQFSPAAETCTGETIRLALDVGAQMKLPAAGNGLWFPSSIRERGDGTVAVYPHIVLDRAKPGVIAVNAAGRRFVNEAVSYHAFGEALFHANQDVRAIPAALVCDSRFIKKYGLGMVRPKSLSVGRYIKSGYLKSAATLEELAAQIDVDPVGLADTVNIYNSYTATGVDLEFGKGANPYDQSNGDPENRPNPCIGPIIQPPFYAVLVVPTPLGTAAGLAASVNGEVLDEQSRPIAGLYACGNDMSSIMGGEYIGPGGQLGPGMTFAYLAAKHASRRVRRN